MGTEALVFTSKRTRSLKAGFDAQHACIRIGAAFLNQLATTKRTSRPSISRPLGYRVPVAVARCYYRRGARAWYLCRTLERFLRTNRNTSVCISFLLNGYILRPSSEDHQPRTRWNANPRFI